MKRILTQSLSLLPRNFLSLQTLNSNFAATNNSSLISQSVSVFSFLKNFSTKFNSSSENTNSVTSTNHENESRTQIDEADDDVSSEELKRRIEKFYEGDVDAIPSIFEAILKRKLAGKHDESDNELLEEFGSKSPDDKDFDSE